MSKPQDPYGVTRFRSSLLGCLALLVALSVTFGFYAWSEKQIDAANDQRYLSITLADELRQSSDDLTRMVRTHVVTGNPRYKQYFQMILDIRDGNITRPPQYDKIYWDFVIATGTLPTLPAHPSPSLLERMQRAGFTEDEFQKLREAKINSDTLTKIEFAAMALIESAAPHDNTQRETARAMVHDQAYHQFKASIMQPINEFLILMDARTQQAVDQAIKLSQIIRYVFIVLGLLFMHRLWRTYQLLHDVLGGSLDDVHHHIATMGNGDFTANINVKPGLENTIMGWLLETQSQLRAAYLEQKRNAEMIWRQANYDLLTDLPNRRLFTDRFEQAAALAARRQEAFALALLDFDKFKKINDKLGHDAGDKLLTESAQRLQLAVRSTDTVARLGGDEFAVILAPSITHTDVEIILRRILETLHVPIAHNDQHIDPSASIGVAWYPQDGKTLVQLYKAADMALYQSKAAGRNNYHFYSA